ncbi:MAG: monovalent cation/H(+) antiporter subunit G [Burkholderiales bacterium]|nr:monovalent cation/H(+) antiporter subunit G [Burkholderiales bacterium]MBK8666090.1 monovalent cation/H(+) antiporter subunit G [Burkholderiales bacterium]
MNWLASLCLIAGALICFLAAAGVLRLPDFFMRMHAATKAGVVGSGLVLLGVAISDGSLATWVKAGAAVVFLLLTTPVAGHLLGRAAYVGGAPLWRGTAQDSLAGVLPRGHFGGMPPTVEKVILALAAGPRLEPAIVEAIALAREHDAELCGVALIDAPRLNNVGPAPIGAIGYAQRMRDRRLAQARRAAADTIQRFESAASAAGLKWSVRLEEGRPRRLLHALDGPATVVAVAPLGWFDQGVLDMRVDVARRLRWQGRAPLRVLGLGM